LGGKWRKLTLKPYSQAFKRKMIRRMTGKDAVSACQLSRETGVTQQSLSRWLREARSLPVMSKPKSRKEKVGSVEDKARILAEAGKLTGAELDGLLEREGLVLAQLEQWRLALQDEGYAGKATIKRIRKLERELARKETALVHCS
jgi:transposase-like protein